MEGNVRALFVCLVFVVVACSGPPGIEAPGVQGEEGAFTYADTVKLPDGRTMECLFWQQGTGQYAIGGMSCNWGAAK